MINLARKLGLEGFQQWLSGQAQHSAVKNYAWWSLVLREVSGHGNEDDLAYPGDDALVIDHLFARLREFLSLSAPRPGRAWRSASGDRQARRRT